MLAPLRAASRMRCSARRQFASRSLIQENWTAPTVITRGGGAGEAADGAAGAVVGTEGVGAGGGRAPDTDGGDEVIGTTGVQGLVGVYYFMWGKKKKK